MINLQLPKQKTSLPTIKRIYKVLGDIIHPFAQQKMESLRFEGPVEIDETLLYRLKRGYRGRLTKVRVWLVGIKCRLSRRFVIYPVLRRTRPVILSILDQHVEKMAVVYTDSFSVYVNNRVRPKTSHLTDHSYLHLWVDHSKGFIYSLRAEIHTNTIERAWRTVKTFMRKENPRKYILSRISKLFFFHTYGLLERNQILMQLMRTARTPSRNYAYVRE